jgi:hypothetical protein
LALVENTAGGPQPTEEAEAYQALMNDFTFNQQGWPTAQ